MKIVLLLLGCFYALQVAAIDFHDPMQPPAFALNKFRLEKLKNLPATGQPAVKQQKQDPWILNSILYSSNRQHAIINNKLVRKGEVIAGAKLISLESDSVRLISRGKVVVLKLPGASQSIKKSHNEKQL